MESTTRPGDWWRHGVFYQIYPRSFQDSNGDGVGDLRGIISRLDHLNDGTPASLGIDAIWISPFYRSPMADFGYDVEDYCDVDPVFGTLADFDELLTQAHRRGIRVIVDFVPNHTSDRHRWFVESRSSRSNPKRDWYVWRDPKPDGSPPNNWQSIFPIGAAWTLHPRTGQYYLHSFLREQPDLNWWNPEVRAAMEGVLRFWLDRGVDGFRIDVPHLILKDPELGDNPIVDGVIHRTRNEDWPGIHEIFQSWRRLLDTYDERMMVGEVYILDLARMVRYYGEANDELQLAFNFLFLRQDWRAEAFRGASELFESVLPAGSWPDHTLSNHDVPRARSRYDAGGGSGLRRGRVAAMMLLTLRGTPFIYYGEEIGMSNGEIPPDRVVDVHDRDPERTPMQWEPGLGAGFTIGEPWLPIGSEADRVNVAVQRDDPRSMLSFYRRLIWYRKGSPALTAGSYRILQSPEGLFAFERAAEGAEDAEGERLLVALNFTADAIELEVLGAQAGWLELSTDPNRELGCEVGLSPLRIAGDEGVVVRLDG